MYISSILMFNKDDCEAEVYVSDGTFAIMCYAYPVDSVCLGQEISAVFSYGCKNVKREGERTFRIRKLPQYYAYSVTAQVLSHRDGFVQVGKIRIQLDTTIPADIPDGDYVSFSVVRFDFSLH